MNDFIINVMISNVWYMLLFFLTILLLMHAPFLWHKNLSKKAWKKIDYLWLFAALIGIISLASEQRIDTAKRWFEIEEHRLKFLFSQIKYDLDPSIHSYFCTDSIRTEYSPDNFDEIERNRKLECKWMMDANKSISQYDVNDHPAIDFENLPSRSFKPMYPDIYEHLKQTINDYNKQRFILLDMKELSQKNNFEKSLFSLAPFLLLFALALRITKVTGELRHDNT